MNIVAAIFADFVDAFTGGPSTLAAPLGRRSVFEHTLTRFMRIDGIQRRCVVVRPRDENPAREVIRRLGLEALVDVLPIDDGRRPLRPLIRCGRVWNLDAWRGSPLSSWFDEYVEPLNVGRVLDHYRADAVLCLDGHQPALDSEIASGMVVQHRENEDKARFTFTQAPPGLAGIILGRDVTRDFIADRYPVGLLVAYRPELAQIDPITKEPCYRLPAEICQTRARFTADTRAGRELLAAAFEQLGDDCNARRLCDWTAEYLLQRPPALPHEVELEITTADPLPETALRPRGSRVPRRELTDLTCLDRLVAQLAAYDDRLLVLGGFGDPLLHSKFPEICHRIRSARICGVGVVTPLVELTDANLDALTECGIDLLEVLLDANTADTYRTVNRADRFAQVVGNIERVQAARRERGTPRPLVVCSLTRCTATFPELEVFFEQWSKIAGWAVIRGYNDYCGLLPADEILSMRPLLRTPCRRIDRRMMLLADGRAVYCSQDYSGVTAFGSWQSDSLDQLWRGAALQDLRKAHRDLELPPDGFCSGCGEWFRP